MRLVGAYVRHVFVIGCVLQAADAASTRGFTRRATVLKRLDTTVGLMSTSRRPRCRLRVLHARLDH